MPDQMKQLIPQARDGINISFDVKNCVKSRNSQGGTATARIRAAISKARLTILSRSCIT